MELQNRSLLYFDERFLDTCYSYTYNELIILYTGFKEAQISSELSVCVDISSLKDYFMVEDDVIRETINRFCATSPVKPILFGAEDKREVFYPVSYSFADFENGTIFISFNECIKEMVIDIKNPVVINLDIVKMFKKKKDRPCYDIKIYESLSCIYNSIDKHDVLYIPFTLDGILFRSSIFNLYIKKYLEQYKSGVKIFNITKSMNTDENYKRPKNSWGVFSRSYVRYAVETINKYSDIYIEGYKPITYLAKTTGVIFKIKRNAYKDIGYLKELAHRKTKDEEDFYGKCRAIYESKS